MLTKRDRALMGLLTLLFAASTFCGIPMAVFGSRSDVSPGEQAAAFFLGGGMTVAGIVGFVFVASAKSRQDLMPALVCSGVSIVSFLLALKLAP